MITIASLFFVTALSPGSVEKEIAAYKKWDTAIPKQDQKFDKIWRIVATESGD